MNNGAYELVVNRGEITNFVKGLLLHLDRVREPVQNAMGEKFFEIVRLNFGQWGVDRPIEWAPLSRWYAKQVGRDYATLFLTGKLESSVKFETTPDCARVSVSDADVEYATRHQYGDDSRHLPARPYFPIDNSGDAMPFTREQVEQAARDEFARVIGSGINWSNLL
jgi:phage gpG-like protein